MGAVIDIIELECRSCGKKHKCRCGTEATNILCHECGGSLFDLKGEYDQYSFQCPRCHKEFLINSKETFDARELKHCQLHLYRINPVIINKPKEKKAPPQKEIKSLEELQNKNRGVLDLPIKREVIENIKGTLPKDKFIIGVVVGPERDHKFYEFYGGLVELLKKSFFVFKFEMGEFNQKSLIEMNECDLIIGQYNRATKYAFILRIPTLIIHTEVNVELRGEASYIGINDAKPSLIVERVKKLLKDPSLSYCIVTHNRKDAAQECLNAIYENKKQSEEVIIIDNHSTLRNHLKPLENRSDTKIVYNSKNIGCTLARNQAMKAARGRTLLILDSDQIIRADTVHRMKLCSGDIIGSEGWTIDRNGKTHKLDITATDYQYVGAGGMMLSRQIAETLNYFDEQFVPGYYEDPDFCLRARERGYEIRVCDSGIIHKGPGMDEALGEDAGQIKERNRVKFIEKWKRKEARAKNLSTKPQIMMLVDVPDWAWDVKAKNIKRWLSEDYNIHIKYQHEYGDYITENFDIYFVFDCIYVKRLAGKAANRIIGGVTAHTYVNFDGYKGLLERCGAVHANSMMLFEELKQINSNAFYVPNGVDEKLFKFVDRDIRKKFTVGYVGKEHDRKGYKNYIVPACEKASVTLKAQTAKYNEPGKIEPKDMPTFYHDVDCIIIASDMDGTPNQLLEAAATGRTFVGVIIGNVPEFYKSNNGNFDETGNGIMCKRDIDDIAKHLIYLKKHRKECRIMGIEARKTVETGWTWKKQAENYRKLFDAVLESIS